MDDHDNTAPDAWETPQSILVLLAHPDDPEFFCGATIAKWAAAGHHIQYCLMTCGDKGTKDRALSSEDLCRTRQQEQQAAASVLGVEKVQFLGYPDGYLVPDLGLRKDVTRAIRQVRPDIIIACDPLNLYGGGTRLNHPDHRAAGQVVLDAVFPAARDHLYFEDLLLDEHLEPHVVREVWVSIPNEANVTLDVTPFWETKIRALLEHKTQIGDPEKLQENMRKHAVEGGSEESPRYEERFRRLVLG